MIISSVGAKSRGTRVAYGFIFGALILGSVTMVYPFLLMLAGSVKSEADAHLLTPYPEFWFNKTVLFRKYAESKHNADLDNCRKAWGAQIANWRRIEAPPAPDGVDAAPPAMDGVDATPPAMDGVDAATGGRLSPAAASRIEAPAPAAKAIDAAMLADFREWRETPQARAIGILGHASGARLFPENARRYRARAEEKSGGDLEEHMRRSGVIVSGWSAVSPPPEMVGRYRNTALTPAARAEYEAFKASRPGRDLYFVDPEAQFAFSQLTNRMDYLRAEAPLQYIRLGAEAADAYRAFVARRHNVIRAYNAAHGTAHESFGDIPFPRMLDDAPRQRVEWEEFLRDEQACRGEWIELRGPRELFAEFRAAKGRAGAADALPRFGEIAARADYEDCMADASYFRKEFTKRNYAHVLDYLAKHGNGIANTLLYCALSILTALLVNPLCAYALSRFKLPGTYRILLFCMATMAFPAEVSMIPSFILMKRFPLWPILGAAFAMAAAYLLAERLRPQMKERSKLLLAFAAALAVGALALPLALGSGRTTVSLLNTFAALVLPGAANGYFIFLLKGFFDSMPKELYEAADLDGAGEWTKFWTLTMSLSKPILAVVALNAFTSAYSAFMMALIIIPDEKMWTMMVWIFQLQSYAHGSVVYASIVVSALPTFLIFAFCQNIIIRGIVVPTEK